MFRLRTQWGALVIVCVVASCGTPTLSPASASCPVVESAHSAQEVAAEALAAARAGDRARAATLGADLKRKAQAVVVAIGDQPGGADAGLYTSILLAANALQQTGLLFAGFAEGAQDPPSLQDMLENGPLAVETINATMADLDAALTARGTDSALCGRGM